MAILALHQFLRLAHAGGGIAGGIRDEELDRPAEQPALGVLDLRPEFGAVLLLLPDGPERAGQRERHADPDRVRSASDARKRGRGKGTGDEAAGDEATAADAVHWSPFGACGLL